MKTSLEMVDISETTTTLSSPAPHNPNYDIPKGHFRVNIPWEWSCLLGFNGDLDYAMVYKVEDDIVLSANLMDEDFYGEVKLYYHKENGNPKSTNVDTVYDSQFITLPEIDFTNYSVGDTINMEYINPAPKNAYFLYEHVSMDDVLEGERHIRLSKGEKNGLDTTDNPSDGQIQRVEGEGHSTV